MTKYVKSPMHEGQNKIARLIRLDQLMRFPEGMTLKEILDDEQIDNISKRLLQDNLKEMAEKYGAEFESNLYRGNARLWKYKDSNFSIMKQTQLDLEIIRKSIENLNLFKGDPRYDMLRFYLIGLENGKTENSFGFMSFDNSIDVVGLEFVDGILDAIMHHYPLRMIYKPFNNEKFETNIHPYHIRQYNKRWFLFAYAEDREDILNYALDRIVKIEHLNKPYIESDVNFEEYFDDIVGVSNYKASRIEKIIIKVDKKSIDYIRTKPLHWTQKELKNLETDQYVFIQLEVKINTELKMLLFSYSDAVEVIEPVFFRKFFKNRIEVMSKKYEV